MSDDVLDFNALMDLTSDDAEKHRPKSAPESFLTATISAYNVTQTNGENKSHICRLTLIDLRPAAEDDATKLEGFELSKLRSPYATSLSAEWWLTQDAIYRFTAMLDRVVGADGRTVKERMPDLRNARVLFRIRPVLEKGTGKQTGQNSVDTDSFTKASE